VSNQKNKPPKVGYYRRRKPKDVLLQNYIGVDHALMALQRRISHMKNPSKQDVIDLIKTYRSRVAEYTEAISPGSSKVLWSQE
jgi:hypothetical protein